MELQKYYQSLAALLPPLLSYPSSDSPRLIRSSRIDEGGVLPFVPCTIMPYHTSSSISACFTHKLATHSSFNIHFMGDSKIREIFYAFLERIDGKLHFSVKLGVGWTSRQPWDLLVFGGEAFTNTV
ncbi:hypothetical protein Pcinc_005979 [Petrolisthes cinctipes]|uniref:Uncharacterized protein n=1 Tax=Petrolisthes cinctipes TaxID=88211 RepID=A0AAE1KYS6_PETCI|nr:hypothetical protein Pcinc_005979 [Petrolisthes cinctipes]